MKIAATAYVLTLNSAATLPACLESLRVFEDILVLDGNSTDGTREIAESFGARVVPQSDDRAPEKRIENFTEVRERAFGAAKYDWIFQLDSDEVAAPEVIESVRTVVEKGDVEVAMKFQRLAMIDGKIIRHAYFYPEFCLRLINRESGIAWNSGRAVHERLIIPAGVRVSEGRGEITQAWPSLVECRKKDRRYLSLAVRPLKEHSAPLSKIIRACGVNVAKGFYVAFRIAALHTTRKSGVLPLAYHLRFPAYHFSFAARLAFLTAKKLFLRSRLQNLEPRT